jgi:hypothetical protein
VNSRGEIVFYRNAERVVINSKDGLLLLKDLEIAMDLAILLNKLRDLMAA